MRSLEDLTAACRAAVAGENPQRDAHVAMKAFFDDVDCVRRCVGTAEAGGIEAIVSSDELTILNMIWKPGMDLMPHNHEMWAVIGIYKGEEENTFWRKAKNGSAEEIENGRIEVANRKTLKAGDVTVLGKDIIHSVRNPLNVPTGAIHVYGGDFFGISRSEWDPATLFERPFDIEKTKRMFAD